ncbi:MAG: outer membrane lipoprotein chaperone LolA [Acidobacteriia bacterium]|nr:outer membrane lipoprotein chaperone LolA [Terriglobia bacterium]
MAKFARSAALGISVLAALTFAALAAAGAAGAPSDLEDYVQALESSYHDVRTLRAEFTQTYTWGARTRVESGTVNFARGGLMRWDYREPAPKLFLATGKEVYLYIPSENQVTRSSVKSSEDLRVPFRLLLSRLDLRKVFARIEFADGALEVAPGDRVLRAVPKHGEETYREVLMEVTPNLDIRRLVVSYADRSRMEFDFNRIERNVALDPALFRFTPPQGAEVIKQP